MVERPGPLWHIRAARRCRSSVVEHSLGKGEAVSSILTGSTITSLKTLKTRFARASRSSSKTNRNGIKLSQLRGEAWGGVPATFRSTFVES